MMDSGSIRSIVSYTELTVLQVTIVTLARGLTQHCYVSYFAMLLDFVVAYDVQSRSQMYKSRYCLLCNKRTVCCEREQQRKEHGQ